MAFRITEKNSTFFPYKQHAWRVYSINGSQHINRYLIKSFTYVETMLMLYSKVFMLRIDLSPPAFNNKNNTINAFLRKLNRLLYERYQCQCSYICAREQNTSDREHYHLAVLLSGHKIKYPHNLVNEIKQQWQSFIGGSACVPESCYYMLKRGKKHSIERALYRLSYLTKTITKNRNPKGINAVVFSQLTIPEAINQGCNDILLVDNRYNPPLPRIRVLPLLYSTSEPRPKTVNMPCISLSVLGAAHAHEKPILTGNNLAMDTPAYHYKEWMQ